MDMRDSFGIAEELVGMGERPSLFVGDVLDTDARDASWRGLS